MRKLKYYDGFILIGLSEAWMKIMGNVQNDLI